MKSQQNIQTTDILLTICPPWGTLSPPLGLAYIAESLENKGVTVEIYDFNILLYRHINQDNHYLWETKNDDFWRTPHNVDTLIEKWATEIALLTDYIANSKSPLIGCSVVDPNEFFTSRILSIIKKKCPQKIIIAGGPGCADLGQRKMLIDHSQGAIDYFIIGEGEESITELVASLKGDRQPKNIANCIIVAESLEHNGNVVRPNLHDISFPRFKSFNINHYGRKSLALMWSRGCIGRCLYCKERALWGPYRIRALDSILEELHFSVNTLKISNFVIYDSAVNGNPQQLSLLCDAIIKQGIKITWSGEAIALKAMDSTLLKKMSAAGCHTLVYGIESGSDKILASMQKLCNTKTASQVIRRTHEAGIKVAINILVGFPGESEEDFQQTIDFLIKHSPWIDRLDGVSTLQIVANTPLEKKTAEFGIVLPSKSANDKWAIPESNTFEIRQRRLTKILEIAAREGFEVGRTFLSDESLQVSQQQDVLTSVPFYFPDNSTNSPSFPAVEQNNINWFPKLKKKEEHSKNILIVTCQPLPVSGTPTTGGSLRAYHLGEALKECGHQILYSIPEDCLITAEEKEQWQNFSHNGSNIAKVIKTSGAELVLFSNWGLACATGNCVVPTVIDMNGSLVLENFYRKRDTLFQDSIAKLETIAKADYLIAGSKQQKAYLIAWYLMAGLDPDTPSIGIVPFSLSSDAPQKHKNNAVRFILAGYDWPWLKGEQQLQTVCNELTQHKNASLHLYTAAPPYSDIINEDSSADSLGGLLLQNSPNLVKHLPLDFTRLTSEFAKATVALDLWEQNSERDLAFPSRTVAYLWAGLPVITSPHGELSELIALYQAGWLIESDDTAGLQALTKKIAEGVINIEEYQQNARRLFSEHLTRNKTITDLNNFCCNPSLNRTVSPFVAKYSFMKELSLKLQRQTVRNEEDLRALRQTARNKEDLQALRQKFTEKNAESEIMGLIHRRPKGFMVLQSWSLLKGKLRRLIIGTPVLLYMASLTLIGHFLHLMWIRKNRS